MVLQYIGIYLAVLQYGSTILADPQYDVTYSAVLQYVGIFIAALKYGDTDVVVLQYDGTYLA